jgi:hypothetical protein
MRGGRPVTFPLPCSPALVTPQPDSKATVHADVSGARKGDGSPARFGQYYAMDVRTRGLDIAINAKRQIAEAAARAEAKAVIERW